jgi:hypothetical protein
MTEKEFRSLKPGDLLYCSPYPPGGTGRTLILTEWFLIVRREGSRLDLIGTIPLYSYSHIPPRPLTGTILHLSLKGKGHFERFRRVA